MIKITRALGKKHKLGQVQWLTPVIPATQEVEIVKMVI
jgi:hypothetical protein